MSTDPLRDREIRRAIVALGEGRTRACRPLVVTGGVVQLAPDVEGATRPRAVVARLASNGRWYLWGEPTRGLAYPRTHNRTRGRKKGSPQRVRAQTLNLRRMPKAVVADLAAEYPPEINAAHAAARPRVYGDCERQGLGRAGNPCPWVSCKHHLYLEVGARGNIRLAQPDKEPWELEHTCALRVAASGGATLEEVGALQGITRERARQIEERLLAKVRRHLPAYTELAPAERAEHWSDTAETGAGWYARGKR